MLRNRENINIDELFGVDLSDAETKTPQGRFRSLENWVPLGTRALQRKPGTILVIDQSPYRFVVDNLGNLVVDNAGNPVTMPSGIVPVGTKVAKLHTFIRPGVPSELLAVIHQASGIDILFKRTGSTWTAITGITGVTGGKYDMVTWQGKVIITNGVTDALLYDGVGGLSALTGTSMPTRPQYCTVYQERIILAGGPDNRHRVWFSDPLVSNFQATSFHDVRVGTGGEISGLGVNSITSSDSGTQNQLIILKTDAVASILGELGTGQEILAVRSAQIGCPSHKTLVNSQHGLTFCGNDSVYFLDHTDGEPLDIGAELGNEIRNSGNLSVATGKIFNGFYHLSVAAPGGTVNSREWMLSLNPRVFPREFRWYGPHSGDQVSDYAVIDNQLLAVQESSTSLWRLVVPGNNVSMMNPFQARMARMILPRISSPEMRASLFDAVGVNTSASRITITTDIAATGTTLQAHGGTIGSALVWDVSQWDAATWEGSALGVKVVHPRRRGTNIQVTIEHNTNENAEIHGIWIRHKPIRRQQETR